MQEYDIYKDISCRTSGDIYIGVVGPVRTGKSTFITKMMEQLVLPNVLDESVKSRVVDELPQSGQGKMVMTTQPKFVPDHAVTIEIDAYAELNIRMVDCVGYLVEGASGHEENGIPRMVKTPWFESDIPFEEAAEIGTKKVIQEHSTIGVVLTTDGSFTEIPRENYVPAEERVIHELSLLQKPFIVILNSTNPTGEQTKALSKELSEKYNTAVLPMDVMHFTKEDMEHLLSQILYEFPLKEVKIDISKWVLALEETDPLMEDLLNRISLSTKNMQKMRDHMVILSALQDAPYVKHANLEKILLGDGTLSLSCQVDNALFYELLSQRCGCQIQDERELLSTIHELSIAKKHYDKLKNAIDSVKQTGYGIVPPAMSDLSLEEPEMVSQGNKFGVRLKAQAPTLHMIRVDVETEVNPIIGSERQSEEFMEYLMQEFKTDPQKIWDTDIFGKPLSDIVKEGLMGKISNIPEDGREKLRETLARVINEGDGGMLFILL